VLNFFTRGGQITLHSFHMFKQICLASLLITVCVGISIMTVQIFKQTTPYQRYLYKEMLGAEWRINMSHNNTSKAAQEFQFENGIIKEVKSEALLKDRCIQKHMAYMDNLFAKNAKVCLIWMLSTLLLLMGGFIYGGYLKSRKILERGNHIVSKRQLRGILRRANLDSDLHLDKLPLLQNKETSHILVSGTTSSGKTNCFHTLLPQIQRRTSRGWTNRAIVVDMTGDYVSTYFRENQDFLLNPLDVRTKDWSPWADCLAETHYDSLAASLVPKLSVNDTFWQDAGKILFATALKELQKRGECDVQRLYRLLVHSTMSELCAFFQNTDAAPYTQPEGERMTSSIKATITSALQGIKYLKNTNDPFSIRKWIHQDSPSHDSWLFISIKPDQRETLIPLVSAWFDTAINALMTLGPDSERRLWFILDELPALQQLPSLEVAMAESRKYGGCVLAGIQSYPQLYHIYGQHRAQSILDLFNTKIFFRNADPAITQWISKVLGEAEITEHHENLSYGAHSIRDGVSLSLQTRTKPLVLPTEIANLHDREAFLKFPGPYPVCRTRLRLKKATPITPGFEAIPPQPNL